MPTSPRSKFHPIRNKFQQIRNSRRNPLRLVPASLKSPCHCEARIATPVTVSLARNDMVDGLRRKNAGTTLFGQKGYPFRSVHRGRAVAKIDHFLGWGNVYCTHNSARLEGSGEVALIAGAINSKPPQPASLVSFLPEQERYPPEELHLQIPQRVSFSTQKDT